jgi:oligosaccharide repeat unit polymerase
MIALATSFVVAVLALFLPNATPFSRVWRPSFLFGAFSTMGLSVTYFQYTFDGLYPAVVNLYALGTFSFFFADLLSSTLMRPAFAGHEPQQFSLENLVRSVPAIYIYLALGGIGALLAAYIYRERASMFNMFELGSALRYAEVNRLPTYGAPYFLLFAQAIGSVFVLSPKRWIRMMGMGVYLVLLMSTFISLSRTTAFFILSSLAFLYYVRSGSFRSLIGPVVAIVILTFGFAYLRGQEGTEESFFFSYAGYAIYAFNYFVINLGTLDYGVNSFGSVAKIFSWGVTPEDLSINGTEYNVYTFLGAPYRDFGWLGVLVMPFLFGLVWSFVWNRVSVRPIYLFMYSWMIFPCIIPFFDWKFNLTAYLYLIPIYLLLLIPHFKTSTRYPPATLNRARTLGPAGNLTT